MTRMPDDPMSLAHEAWVAMHEMFLSMRQAGFNREDAAAVLAAIFKAQQQEGSA